MNNTNHNTTPRRLIESQEVGQLLREAAEVGFDEKRLQRNKVELLARVSCRTAKQEEWRRLFSVPRRRRVAFVAFAAFLLFSVGAAALLYFETVFTLSHDTETEDERRPIGPVKSTINVGSGHVSSQTEPDAIEDANIETATEVDPSADSDSRAKGRRSMGRGGADSTLNEQVRLFNNAKSELASGAPLSALKYLNRLKQRYPTGPLQLESKELRAHVLARLMRYGEASRAVRSLVSGKISTRKKAQLYRFLGDLQVKQGHCDDAVKSYRLSLGLGLSGAESDAAKAGIRNCMHRDNQGAAH